MIGKISSADYRVNCGSGVKPAAKYKEQLASVIKTELPKAADKPGQRVNLLRAWEKLLNWEQKPLELDLLSVFKDALKNGRWNCDAKVKTTFFTNQDHKIRQDVVSEVESALKKDDTLYVTGLITDTGDKIFVARGADKHKLLVPVEYANGRTINFLPARENSARLPLTDEYMVFDSKIIGDDSEELRDAIKTDLMIESLKKTSDELWEKYGTEINEFAQKFDSLAKKVK